MFASSLRSVARPRVAGRPAVLALSTQISTLYFCGPKSSDHDPDIPISQHYHARSRASGLNARLAAESLLATPSTRPTLASAQPATATATATTTATGSITPTLRISVTHAPPSLSGRHIMPSTNKQETAKKAIGQLEAATHDEATTYNTAIVIIQEIATLQFVLRKGEVEGKNSEEMERVRRDIEDLRSLFDRMEKKM